ncbi:uncharacterized protein LOC120128646 [Hibiscus syriacus]|uniref:uncharacterized protein LOC120128646 n=1 Tax=Hibiscus syriacus TaxID=106335 RepID=UPI00192130D5|nr:uncharacterized protein LOC120128646 [Hibiscus syriacus]
MGLRNLKRNDIVPIYGKGENIKLKKMSEKKLALISLQMHMLANAEVKDMMLNSLLPAAGQFDEKSIGTMLDLETIKEHKEIDHTIKDKNAIQYFSPQSARKRTNGLNRTKVKDAPAQCVNNSDLDASKHSAGYLNKKNKLNSSSLEASSEEATMHTSISAPE